ncbi:hypothetical protein VP01_1817g4 [Puccinia sorghi]|uniref:Uncharacterized protein n=1 Tax=Puccinia sorghi TaxID=27349 RepID=A0A0L6VFY6_9BASI|nr:hypothetical protein VP01_1817g4 [Puccinia sorghi]
MTFSKFCYIPVAAAFLVLLISLTFPVNGAFAGPRAAVPQCAPEANSINPIDCNIAVLTLPFTDLMTKLVTNGNYVTSQFKSCQAIVSCASKTQTTSAALLTDSGNGGGYNLLVQTCGAEGKAGTIYFDQDCTVRVTKV